MFVVAVTGIVSAETGTSGAANVSEKGSVASAGDRAHARGGGAPGHANARGDRWESWMRVAPGAGTETEREQKRTPSLAKEAESATGTESARGGAGAGRGGETGSEGKAQREAKRAQGV